MSFLYFFFLILSCPAANPEQREGGGEKVKGREGEAGGGAGGGRGGEGGGGRRGGGGEGSKGLAFDTRQIRLWMENVSLLQQENNFIHTFPTLKKMHTHTHTRTHTHTHTHTHTQRHTLTHRRMVDSPELGIWDLRFCGIVAKVISRPSSPSRKKTYLWARPIETTCPKSDSLN